MSPEWVAAAAAIAAVGVSVIALIASLKRANQDALKDDLNALSQQMKALEIDVAKNYVMRPQMDQAISALGQRLENLINNVTREIAELNRWLRKAPP
jgi:hypothetical protein